MIPHNDMIFFLKGEGTKNMTFSTPQSHSDEFFLFSKYLSVAPAALFALEALQLLPICLSAAVTAVGSILAMITLRALQLLIQQQDCDQHRRSVVWCCRTCSHAAKKNCRDPQRK